MLTVLIALCMASIAFLSGMLAAYAYVSQEYHARIMDLQVEIGQLKARGLPPRRIELVVQRQGRGPLVRYLDTVDAGKVELALRMVANGARSFSESGLSGVLTRRELRALRGELIASDMLRWHPGGKQQGVLWTTKGQQLLAQVAEGRVSDV